MSIFGRDEPSQPQPAAPNPTPPQQAQPKPAQRVTQISPGTTIQGEISGATAVQIDGAVEGRVTVDGSVRVEANGRVKGEIAAREVTVAGKVVGNIVGGDKVDIQSSGKLQGDVKAPRVSIADGAYFKGRVEMTGQTKTEAAKPAKPAVATQPKLDAVPLSDTGK